MSPQEYKQKLREFFTGLSTRDSESAKLRKIDAFKKLRGIKKHLKTFVLVALVFVTMTLPVLAQGTTLIPETGDKYGLAEKFQSGKFEVYDIPFYVLYLIEVLIYFAGGIAVLFVVIGGYQYMIGGLTEDKESGKKTIGFALGGFAVALLAWTIVNFLQVWLTSGGA
jgi:hypothetical protein